MRRAIRYSVLAGVGVTTLGMASAQLDAQAHPNPATPDSIRRIQTLEPRSGPPGTEVTVYTENLPLQATVVLGVGAIGQGFEELGRAEQGEFGEVGGTLTVPAAASWERPLVFIIFNGNFAPTGMSDPFHVTNGAGQIRRTGAVTDEGEGCLAMRDLDGYLYTLIGDTGDASPGDSVVVEGSFFSESDCAQGHTIHVSKIGAPEP